LTIRFGDGVNGKIPDIGEENIRVTYRIGGGSQSNFITVGKITNIKTRLDNVISVRNTTQPSGGDDTETRDEIRKNAPAVFASGNRVVTVQDYSAVARQIAGVSKVKVARYNGSPLIQAVYVAVNGPNPVPNGTWNFAQQVGTGTLGSVGELLKGKMLNTLRLQVLPVTALNVIVEVEVHCRRNYNQSYVRSKVDTAITDYIYQVDESEIKDLITLSEFIEVLQDVEGVQYVNVKRFQRQAYLEAEQVGYGAVVLDEFSSGPLVQEDTLTIRFLNATSFVVESMNSGTQSNEGVLGSAFTTDDGAISFVLQEGDIAPERDNTYKIVVGEKAGNVLVQDHEIPVQLTPAVITMVGGIPR
jgi:hypothetical protein